MSEPPRSLYEIRTRSAVGAGELPLGLGVRPVAETDDAALGGLMERAYAGTIDEDLGDNNDGAVEIADWRSSMAVSEASFVVVDDQDRPLSASLVSRSQDGAYLIGYVITAPEWKGQGLATAAVAASLHHLLRTTGTPVLAGVTDGNTASERLLTGLGFVRVGPV
jgi:predicted GNAT family acetyltransferase